MYTVDLTALRRRQIDKLINKPKNDPANVTKAPGKDATLSDHHGDNTGQLGDHTILPEVNFNPEREKAELKERIAVEEDRQRLAVLELETSRMRDAQRLAQANEQHDHVTRVRELDDRTATSRSDRRWCFVKRLFLIVFFLLFSILVSLLLYRLYRWTVEAPLIKEVVKQVEVPVEKRVEVPVEKIVEKEVIPEGCSQMRRNGKIYINCDGQKVEGVPTLGEEGLQKAPELLQ